MQEKLLELVIFLQNKEKNHLWQNKFLRPNGGIKLHLKVHRGPAGAVSDIILKPSAKIHIMGVCGTAMSALAGLLKKKGYAVQGSDKAFYPPASEELKRLGIPILKGYKKENIHKNLDLIIVGNVVSKKFPSAEALLNSYLPYISLPEALNSFIIGNKNTIMVCGTHGKTTTSCLSAWVLRECGLDPGFMIGGVAENFKTGFHLSKSNWFVVEGDEYDTAFFEKTPKFIHYPATHTLLNNIEFDHADIYRNIKDVEQAFRLLMEKKNNSFLIAGVHSPLVEKLIAVANQKVITYGIHKGDWRLKARQPMPKKGQILQIEHASQGIEEIYIPLPGEHNALNALSVWVLSRVLNLDKAKTLSAFKSFKGVRRRFQILGDFSGITLVEDFAHHPTAVSAVLHSTREMYPGRRILAVFEPRSNTSRRNIFQKEYHSALSIADLVFCMSAHNTTQILESERFSAKKLVNELQKNGKPAFYAENSHFMTELIQKQALEGDVILLMSNGDFGGIYSLLKNALIK